MAGCEPGCGCGRHSVERRRQLSKAQKARRRTECRRGHSLEDPANVYVYPSTGKRQCLTCRREVKRRWRETNAEHVREYWQEWYVANRDWRLGEYAPQWKAANRERLRDHENRRRAKMSTRADPDTLAYLAILAADPCAYCGVAGEHDDHIEALADGGEHHWTNLARACRACNSSKRDRPLLPWLVQRTFGSRPWIATS